MERVEGGVARSMPFVALRSGTGSVVASTNDAIDIARLLVAWAQMDGDAGLVCTFESHSAASSWLAVSPPPFPTWAAVTCCSSEDDGVIVLEEDTGLSPVFAVLRQSGGQLAPEGDSSLVPRLVNTIKALKGEVVVVRMLASMGYAEEWLLNPRVPKWLLAPPLVFFSPAASQKDDEIVVTATTVNGVVNSTDSEEAAGDIEEAARMAFRRAAQAHPPPPPLKRTILSLSSIKYLLLLPVDLQRKAGMQSVAGGRGAGSSVGGVTWSSTTGESRLTPAFSRSSQESGSGWQLPAAGDGFSQSPRQAARTCTPVSVQASPPDARPAQTYTPVPARDSSPDARPTKTLRPTEPVPYYMGRLANAILLCKKGLFDTGSGGVGKTRLLRQVADAHRDAHCGLRGGLHVLAPTGVAAAAAGGDAIHSYLRLPAGFFDETVSEGQDAARLYNAMDGMTKRRLADTSLVLVDEVSMVSSRMFTVLVYSLLMAHSKMNASTPWRMIVFGDFFQLPPVHGDEDKFDTGGAYAFKSSYWKELFNSEQLQLRYVWRQEDKKFIEMLSRLRVGDVSEDLSEFLQSRSAVDKERVADDFVRDMGVTRIFPRRRSVQAHNLDCLASMEKQNGCARVVYAAMDYPIGVRMTEEQVTKQLNASIMAPKQLEVCVGARLAACATICDGPGEVPNGTVGTVIGYVPPATQSSSGKAGSLPVVRFDTVRGEVVVTVKRVDLKLQSVSRDGAYASRYQITLVLAWAVTIHRCQGLSMDAAVLDLAPCFIDGMVYVALSRVRFMRGVHILSFDRRKVRADRRVALFYGHERDMDDVFFACVDTSRRK